MRQGGQAGEPRQVRRDALGVQLRRRDPAGLGLPLRLQDRLPLRGDELAERPRGPVGPVAGPAEAAGEIVLGAGRGGGRGLEALQPEDDVPEALGEVRGRHAEPPGLLTDVPYHRRREPVLGPIGVAGAP